MRRFTVLFLIALSLASSGLRVDAAAKMNASPVRRQPSSLSALYLDRVLTKEHRLGSARVRPRRNPAAIKATIPSMPVKPLPQVVIPLLAYHHLAPAQLNLHNLAGETTTPEQFEQDLLYLKDKGYTTIFFGDLLNALDGKGELPQKPAIIFFDDGYQSNYVYAWPLLKKQGAKATINLVTSWVTEKSPSFEPAVTTYLSWGQIKEMADSGIMDFQSHTHDLHRQDRGEAVVKRVDEKQLREDFATSKRLIETHTGKPVTVLSYPFAAYTTVSDRVGREFFRISLGPSGADAMGKPLGVPTRRLNVQYYRNAAFRLNAIGQ